MLPSSLGGGQMVQPLSDKRVRWSGWQKPVAIIALGIAIAACLLVYFWPFRRDAVMKELEAESYSKVTAGSFHETYFPRPGCVLEQVVFQHNPKERNPAPYYCPANQDRRQYQWPIRQACETGSG